MKDIIKNKVRTYLTENGKQKNNLVGGVLIKCSKTNKLLLLLRNDGNKEEKWSFVTGGIDSGESVLDGLKREVSEEIGVDPDIIKYKFIDTFDIDNNKVLHYYEGLVDEEFEAKINFEHHEYGWFGIDDLPSPLFKGTKEKINNHG
jgi:8-oxo-dGTP pyrophosphatase MutT (NUDIX family)